MTTLWYAIYRGYDDDALTALANAGVLRRALKDVEAGAVGWLETGSDSGTIEADGQRVVLDGRGPGHARCTCPASGMCKHILAAALWLRTLEPAAHQSDAASSPPPVSALAGVLDLSPDAIFREAGKAAVRRAAARFPAITRVVLSDSAAALTIELPDEAQVVRYIHGAGLAGMVSEAAPADRPMLHVLALALVWREHDRPFAWPEGSDTPSPREPGTSLSAAELMFLDQVRRTLNELLDTGVSHVSAITAQRLLALNMSARSENLPRLAALLRTLAGTVDLLAARDHRADEREALTTMARIHALCAALEWAGGERATQLRGRLRRTFDQTDTLELLPLGAYWWHTRGGARGLAVTFWHEPSGQLVQASVGRPDGSDPAFSQAGAWSRHNFWPGAGTVEQICAAGALTLHHPRMAEDGRIALGGETRAQTAAPWASNDPRLATLGFAEWDKLSDYLRRGVGLSAEHIECVVLRPARVYGPVLDEVRQKVDWVIEDGSAALLKLELPCEPGHQPAIDNLECLISNKADIAAVLARVERTSGRARLRPVALLLRQEAALRSVSLEFAHEKAQGKGALTERILALFSARKTAAPVVVEHSTSQRLLDPLLRMLDYLAMVGHLVPDPDDASLMRQQSAVLRAAGLDAISDQVDVLLTQPSAEAILRLVHLCQTCVELDALTTLQAKR